MIVLRIWIGRGLECQRMKNAKIGLFQMSIRMKLQDTMQKIVNDSNGGMICIII